MKIGIIIGTRPEIIKIATIIYELEKRKINYFLINTSQHTPLRMSKIFFQELRIKKIDY